MDHAKALKYIKSKIGQKRGCVVDSKQALADKFGIFVENVDRFLRGDRPVPDNILDFFGLDRIKHPDTYKKKEAPRFPVAEKSIRAYKLKKQEQSS